jgi:uncharacterized delta-60 repeat protein
LPDLRIVWYVRGLLTRRLLMAFMCAACVSLGTAVSASAAPGDLDTSYGSAGAATADYGLVEGGTVNDSVIGSALVVQPDGKVIVVGTGIDQFGQTSDLVAARFTTGGALDASWGNGGKADFDFGQNEDGYGAVLQPDGKLLIGGDSVDRVSGKGDLLVARINADGTPDTSFGSMGSAHPDLGSSMYGRAIALAPNGKILIAGFSPNGSMSAGLIARLNNPLGTPDTTLAGSGVYPEVPPGSSSSLDAVALGADGSIFTAGSVAPSQGGTNDFAAVDFTTAGSYFERDDLGGDDVATAIALLPAGQVMVAGYTNVHGTYDFAVVRYTANGSEDPSFGTAGRTIVDLGGSDLARAMVMQPDGKIVIAGTTTAGTGSTATSKIGVMRLQSNGQPDPTFGTNGVEVVGIAGAKLVGNAVALQSNGDIVVGGTITPAGSTRKQLLVIRLHGDATGSSGTGGGGTTTTGGSTGTGTGGTGGSSNGGIGDSKTIPVLTSLAVQPSLFDAVAGGPTVITSASSRKGTLVTYDLNVAANVRIVVERSLPGRRQRVNGKLRCEVQTHRNAQAQECVRVVSVGSLELVGKAGANSFRFSGRLDGTRLPHGAYTLIATPKTAITGHAVSKTFKIKH